MTRILVHPNSTAACKWGRSEWVVHAEQVPSTPRWGAGAGDREQREAPATSQARNYFALAAAATKRGDLVRARALRQLGARAGTTSISCG